MVLMFYLRFLLLVGFLLRRGGLGRLRVLRMVCRYCCCLGQRDCMGLNLNCQVLLLGFQGWPPLEGELS